MHPSADTTSASNPALVSIACILGAAICISLGDMTMKRISETSVPLHQAVAVRSVIAILLTLIFLRGRASVLGAFRTRRPLQHLYRGLAIFLANITFFAALAALPMADATAIFFVAPMILVILSAVFVGDHIGPVRWAALIVGFGGVLLVVQPGSPDFTWVLCLPVISAAAYAIMQTFTRSMGMQESTVAMALYVQISFLVGSLLLAGLIGDGRFAGADNPAVDFLLRSWVIPTAYELGLVILTGLVIAIGGYLISQAYRLSPAGVVAPFEYSTLVLAVFWGIVIWGDFPDVTAAFGIALILFSGVAIAIREMRAGRRWLSAARMTTRR